MVTAKLSRFDGIWPAVLIALAGAGAYANSFSGPFVFDDTASVTDNRSIRHLSTAFWPDHGLGQTVEGRPILNLSLALNYAISGTQVWSYHLLNLLIHVLAGLTLFGIVRRTLERWECSRFREKSEVGTGGPPVPTFSPWPSPLSGRFTRCRPKRSLMLSSGPSH